MCTCPRCGFNGEHMNWCHIKVCPKCSTYFKPGDPPRVDLPPLKKQMLDSDDWACILFFAAAIAGLTTGLLI